MLCWGVRTRLEDILMWWPLRHNQNELTMQDFCGAMTIGRVDILNGKIEDKKKIVRKTEEITSIVTNTRA